MEKESIYSQEDYALLFNTGDERGMAFFFQKFHSSISIYCFHLLKDRQVAEELATDAFVKTWKFHTKLNSFPIIRAYLYKVAYRDCITHLQRQKRKPNISLENIETRTGSHFESLITAETARLLNNAINDLSPAIRTVLKKYYFENMSTGEIAKEMKLSRYTVKSQKNRGIEALKRKLKQTLVLVIVLLFSSFFLLR